MACHRSCFPLHVMETEVCIRRPDLCAKKRRPCSITMYLCTAGGSLITTISTTRPLPPLWVACCQFRRVWQSLCLSSHEAPAQRQRRPRSFWRQSVQRFRIHFSPPFSLPGTGGLRSGGRSLRDVWSPSLYIMAAADQSVPFSVGRN